MNSLSRSPLLQLAHVHRIGTRIGGQAREVFVFDHHRSAFTVWCHAAQALGAPLTLLSLDRHLDLGLPQAPPPELSSTLESLDAYARLALAPTNDDHIAAAMEAGALADAALIARSHAPPSLAAFQPYRDRAGREHRCAFSANLDGASEDVLGLLQQAPAIALDIDLDCFTTLSDAHPDEVLIWDRELIEGFLFPPDSGPFWATVLPKVQVVTLAREPYHCGGLGRGARLWLDFAEVFFRRLLEVPPP